MSCTTARELAETIGSQCAEKLLRDPTAIADAVEPIIAEALEEVTAERDRLRAALEKYGEHLADFRGQRAGDPDAVCALVADMRAVMSDVGYPGDKTVVCTCGLDALLRGEPA